MTVTLPYPAKLEDTERDLVRQVREGDSDAYRLLVESHQTRIHRLVARLLGVDHGAIDDVVQDVFVRAYFSLDKFRQDAQFGTWITRIAINRARDELKKQSGRVPFDEEFGEGALGKLQASIGIDTADEEQPEETHNLAGRLVTRAVAELPERFRITIMLKDIEGYSYQEVSEILKCSLGTVKSRHARGRAKLKQLLSPYLDQLVRR